MVQIKLFFLSLKFISVKCPEISGNGGFKAYLCFAGIRVFNYLPMIAAAPRNLFHLGEVMLSPSPRAIAQRAFGMSFYLITDITRNRLKSGHNQKYIGITTANTLQ